MKRMAWSLLLILCVSGRARGQEEPLPDPPQTGPQDSQGPDESASRTISPADAAANFETIVNSFITDRSAKGYWPLRDKKTGRLLKLKLESLDPKTVRSTGREGYYFARARLIDTVSGEPVDCEFTVDFTSDRWAVKGMRLLGSPLKPARRASKAKPTSGA